MANWSEKAHCQVVAVLFFILGGVTIVLGPMLFVADAELDREDVLRRLHFLLLVRVGTRCGLLTIDNVVIADASRAIHRDDDHSDDHREYEAVVEN